MPLFHAHASSCAPGAKKHPTGRNTDGDQIRGTPPLCPNVNERLCVEEHLFRADVEERLFRAASACAFNCGLQPRPALKGVHPPAVAAMNGRSSTLMQALVLRARRSIQTEGSQVRHRFVVTTLVSPTPGETKKWGSLSLFRFRKGWASPPKDVSTGSPRSQGNNDAEWRSRSERLSRVGTAALGCPAPRSGGFGSRGVVAQAFSPGSPWVAWRTTSSATSLVLCDP